MITNLKDILVVSDMDNTLLTVEKGIPEYNIKMIEEFQKLGGRFTVATGRSIESVSKNIKPITLNAPAIVYNGGIIYDFESKNIIYKKLLPLNIKTALKEILKEFPKVGCEVMCENYRTYIINSNKYTQKHIIDENLSYINIDLDDIKSGWIKVLFADENANLQKINEFISQKQIEDVDFVMTNEIYFEIMPKNISKGEALESLCDYLQLDINNTVAIGDYYNDIEMLKKAGLSVCVENAPDDIKNICKAVMCKSEDGAVGKLLEKIINTYSI